MIYNINSINRIMSVVEDLRIKDSTSNEENVEQEYLRNYFLPTVDKASNVIDFCSSIGLLTRKNSRLIITDFGYDFLNLNPPTPYRKYEITPTQKRYLIYRIISSENYKEDIQDLLKKFLLNENEQLSLKNSEKKLDSSFLLGILEQLNFLSSSENNLIIEKEYENGVLLYNINSRIESLNNLLENQLEESIRGSIAEYYVLEYEKKRLDSKRNKLISNKINLISSQNVCAGYDIASYDSNESLDFDRFIEVKSSQSPKVHFFISKNEVKKAKQEKERYWIYYVQMKGRKPIKLKIFRNPIETIIKNEDEYNVESSQLEITEK